MEFVGSIKWREAASFDRAGVARLIGHRDLVPGASERSILVGVSLYAASGKLLFGTTDVVVADQQRPSSAVAQQPIPMYHEQDHELE